MPFGALARMAVSVHLHRTGLFEEFAMRAKPRQSQRACIGLTVNQQEVWFEVALTVPIPVTAQLMVTVTWRQCVVSEQSFHDSGQKRINMFAVVRSGLDAFVVAFKGGGSFNRPHSNQP